ncbi:aspartate/glutamate racemase family protein [Candidatus Uabimicrobium sp. HlEnr_7]|uniref:aspartate/glutamate racemase family protein n=1 Tax=Candidatus Uabimicrobium helgolandensis TaxID=3095367 RepID=UPI003557D91F
MSKHIGIVGCSSEGAALCYKTICVEASKKLGEYEHPEVSMHTHSFGKYMKAKNNNDWQQAAEIMLSSTDKLVKCGADFVICPDNTIHQAFPYLKDRTSIPWIHIAEVVTKVAKSLHYKKVAVLGTEFLMTGPVYSEYFQKLDIEYVIPSQQERERIHETIFTELIKGVFLEKSRLYFNEIIQKQKEQGCDAVVLGCTEIPLLVDPNDCPLPSLDSTRLLAQAAIKEACGEQV